MCGRLHPPSSFPFAPSQTPPTHPSSRFSWTPCAISPSPVSSGPARYGSAVLLTAPLPLPLPRTRGKSIVPATLTCNAIMRFFGWRVDKGQKAIATVNEGERKRNTHTFMLSLCAISTCSLLSTLAPPPHAPRPPLRVASAHAGPRCLTECRPGTRCGAPARRSSHPRCPRARRSAPRGHSGPRCVQSATAPPSPLSPPYPRLARCPLPATHYPPPVARHQAKHKPR